MDYTKIENLAEFKKEEKLLSDCFAKRAACINKVLLLNEGNVNLTAGEETSELDSDERAALIKIYQAKIEKCDNFILATLQKRK